MAQANLLYVGVKGSVLALDRATGTEVWRTKLKGTDFVNLVLDGGQLYATARGEVFRLEPSTGEVVWRNELKGFGLGLVTIGTANSQAASMREVEEKKQAANAIASA